MIHIFKRIAHATAFAATSAIIAAPILANEKPRLVLQLTVDQMRGDMIDRFGSHIGEGGFAYLVENGARFINTHHRHANTETIVGHTTLSTGTVPAIHGMVANVWIDRKTGESFYNVQDPDYPLVGAKGIDQDTEIDPTQRAATTDGRSPRSILSTTISDEIALHFGLESKVFGVSVKDRGAIAMAGHAGQAYWFSKAEGRFVTSTFFREDYPKWMSDWDAKGMVASYENTAWALSGDVSNYAFGTRDDQAWETDIPGFGTVFPHNWGPQDGDYYTTLLTLSPAGDQITVDFAKTLLDAEGLGQDDTTDYLSISLSSTDYVGHMFGPSSLEAEENFAQLDRTLADLFSHVDEQVGLEDTLIVLSADHGAAEHPDYLATMGIPGGLFNFETVDKQTGFQELNAKFGVSEALIASYSNPYVYLDKALIAEKGLDPVEVEIAVAEELQKLPGIAHAIASSDLRSGSFATTRITESVLANFHPDRSGDIYVVFEPHWYIAEMDGLTVASTHGSPWTYDTFVPLFFVGKGIKPQTIARKVETIDVAPTIAAILGTKPPTGSIGLVLPEAMPN